MVSAIIPFFDYKNDFLAIAFCNLFAAFQSFFLGLCLDCEHRTRQLLINGSIVTLLVGFLCITMEFILTHMDDMADFMYAVMQFITFLTVTTCYICFSLRKTETFHFFEKLQSIVNAYHTREKSYRFYGVAEQKAHELTKWPPIIYFASFYGVMIISLINIVVFDLIPDDLHPDTWYTFYKMSAPFNRNTVAGYAMYFIIQVVLLHCYFAGLVPSFSFFLGSCFYVEATCSAHAEQLIAIDKLIVSANYSDRKLITNVTNAIKFHVEVNECFDSLAHIISGILFFQLACGSAFISTTIFQLDIAWGEFDGNFFVIVCVTVLSVMCILPYCYYGTMVSLCLQSIGEFAYVDSLWYKYPLNLREYVQSTIAYSQRKKQFYGFNIFNCSLEVFMKIANASASYYLMFKSF